MTTEKHNLPDAYFNVQQPDVDTIRVSRHDSERYGLEAIVYFGDDVNMHVRTVAKARELLAAAFEALMILDPDGTVHARARNGSLLVIEGIEPDPGPPPFAPDPPQPAPFTSPEPDAPYPGFPERYPSGADSHMTEDGSLPGLVIPPADEQDDFVQDRHADLDPNADEADEQDEPRFAEPAPFTLPPAKADAR
jgi:hypothetical protein